MAVKITCKNNSVIVSSLYRPTNNDCDYSVHLASAVENLVKNHPKGVIWIIGDANLPDIDLSSNTICGSNYMYMYKKERNENFLQSTENCGLDQLVDFPTRDKNVLDVFLSNRPSLIQICKPHPRCK